MKLSKIEVEIEFFEHIPDEDQRYVAAIKEGTYKGTIITAKSIPECFKELGISMHVLDDYRDSLVKQNNSK